MRAVTVRQPWASLIAEGIKTVETRARQHPWASAVDEQVVIHAGADVSTLDYACWYELHTGEPEPILQLLRDRGYEIEADVSRLGLVHARHNLPVRAGIGYGRITGVAPIGDKWAPEISEPGIYAMADDRVVILDGDRTAYRRGEVPLGDYTPGRWGVLFADAERWAVPVSAPGRLGLWEWKGSNVEAAR